MTLIRLDAAELAFGNHHLLEKVNFLLEPGDRIGLIGRNGEGKSTFLKVLAGEQDIDSGLCQRDAVVTVAYVSQSLPAAEDISVGEYVASGAQDLLDKLGQYQALSMSASDKHLDQMNKLQHEIEAVDGWSFEARLSAVLKQFSLDSSTKMSALSGGWRRKASLARALIIHPDVLLLDEPTNHLDVGLIQWLEGFLKSFKGALVVITHDRAFLNSVARSIAELDRGHLTLWKGDYASFVEFKQKEMETEEKHNALFDKRLAQEEAWIRQGIKARRTRNEGRVRALKRMREERAQRRSLQQLGNVEIAAGESSGKLVAEFKSVSFAYDGKTIVEDFDAILLKGDKIGLIGPNGAGKSTLLKLILGEVEPTKGELKRGTRLQVAYFDQMREQLDLDKNIVDNIGEGRSSVEVNGRDVHIMSYIQDFMFSPARARTPLAALSGGERNRVLLAKLFCKPSNLLILDEPTNDLDTDTLELLESLLVNYKGTVLLVSHDRQFLDNVVSSSIVFEGGGTLRESVGGFTDWTAQGGSWEAITSAKAKEADTATESKKIAKSDTGKASKLSYKLQRELDQLPNLISELEGKIAGLTDEISKPEFYQRDKGEVERTLKLLSDSEALLSDHYSRWEELESL